MQFYEAIKKARQRAFYTQEMFANELHIAVSTVNRWESGKCRPSITTMKLIKDFCEKNNISYEEIESSWLDYKKAKEQ